jgi:release factor glutamine methyltransferase
MSQNLEAGASAWESAVPWVAQQLERFGAPSPRVQAFLMVRHVLWAFRGGRPRPPQDFYLTAQEAARLRELVESIRPRTPLEMLREPLHFAGLRLQPHSAAFFTRPDSEAFVDIVVHHLQGSGGPRLIYDVGTGIGSILFACLSRLPHWQGKGFDIALKALVVAGLNHRESYPDLPAAFELNDLLEGVTAPADAITAVLPYGSTSALQEGPNEVSLEPMSVLHGGDDGLDYIRRLIPQAAALTSRLFLEVAPLQIEPTASLLRQAGFRRIRWRKDFQGRRRYLIALR